MGRLSADEVFEKVMTARSYRSPGDAVQTKLIRDLETWIHERSDMGTWDRYVVALTITTIMAPFASELYNYAHQELLYVFQELDSNPYPGSLMYRIVQDERIMHGAVA